MKNNNKTLGITYKVVAVSACLICASVNGQNTTNSSFVKATSFFNTAVELSDSWIKNREKLNTEYVKSLDADRLLHNFRVNAGLESSAQPLTGWEDPGIGLRGHFVGHYLSTVATLVEREKDIVLTNKLTYIIDELEKCQQKLGHGYLSAFPEADFDHLEKYFGGVWAPYYTYNKILQGLVDVYSKTGNQKALKMASGMAGYVEMRMSKLDPQAIEKVLYTIEANPTNEPGAMNECLYKLYRASGDESHLKLAKLFDRQWFYKPLAENCNILSGLHSNTHIVLVNGFAQRYEITGEQAFRDATLNFWNMLIHDHSYVNGSSSGPRPNVVTPTSLTSEHWGAPGHLSATMTKEIAESCVSHNAQKISSTLFSWTADPKYADTYMNTFYNSVMALQSSQTGLPVYHLPLGSPCTKHFLSGSDMRCCSGSSIEAFAQLNSGIYYHDNLNIWINLYVPSRVNWKERGIELVQSGDFPEQNSVDFTVNMSNKKKTTPFLLNLFIPSWVKGVEVKLNGDVVNQSVVPNSYLTLSRDWKNGDKVRIEFEYDFYIQTMPDDNNVVAIFYGPTLLAFETNSELILRGSHTEILANIRAANGDQFILKNNGKEYKLRPLYKVERESYGVYATISKI